MNAPPAPPYQTTNDTGTRDTLPLSAHTQVSAAVWDSFLQQTAGGHHVQSACWAEVKALSGWAPLRIAVLKDGKVVAGIQILLRKVAIWTIGYAGGGPVFAEEDATVREVLIEEIMRQCRKNRISYLVLQPEKEDPVFTSLLGRRGFTPCAAELISRASILIDLSQTEAEIFAQFRKRHRAYVRQAERAGVAIREVGEEEIDTVHALMRSRAERRGFLADSLDTLRAMWRALGSKGLMRMTLAEYEGDVSATLITLGWRDTIYWKRGGWDRRHGRLGLNELQHWESIVWAKRQGYRWVDVEGIDYESAREILYNEKAPYDIRKSPNFFKIGFGGEVYFHPVAQERFSDPFLRFAAHRIYPRLRRTTLSVRMYRWLRGAT